MIRRCAIGVAALLLGACDDIRAADAGSAITVHHIEFMGESGHAYLRNDEVRTLELRDGLFAGNNLKVPVAVDSFYVKRHILELDLLAGAELAQANVQLPGIEAQLSRYQAVVEQDGMSGTVTLFVDPRLDDPELGSCGLRLLPVLGALLVSKTVVGYNYDVTVGRESGDGTRYVGSVLVDPAGGMAGDGDGSLAAAENYTVVAIAKDGGPGVTVYKGKRFISPETDVMPVLEEQSVTKLGGSVSTVTLNIRRFVSLSVEGNGE